MFSLNFLIPHHPPVWWFSTTFTVANTQKFGFVHYFHQYPQSLFIYNVCPFKYDVLKPVTCQVVNACQNVKRFPFIFSFFVTDNDFYVVVVTIKMDANWNLISFLESHS